MANKKVNFEQEMLREQIERLLNQSGVAITPDRLAQTKFFEVTNSSGDEWDVAIGHWKFKITRDKHGKYTCTIV